MHGTSPEHGIWPSPIILAATLVTAGIAASHCLRIGYGIALPLAWLGGTVAVALAASLSRHCAVPLAISCLAIGATLDTMHWRRFDTEQCEGTIHEALIIDTPRHKQKTSQMKVRIAGSRLSPVMLHTHRDTSLCPGRHMLFKATLHKVKPALAHGFDYDTWLLHQGVYWHGYATHHALVADSAYRPPLRERLRARLRASGMSADAEAIAEAMTLGSRHNISPELRQAYSKAGGSHLLALSGLHLGILTGLLMLMLGHDSCPHFLRLGVTMTLVWGYVAATGAPPSLVRSAAMLSVWLAAGCIDWHINGSESLALAVVAILGVCPFWLFDTGFQLSVAAVAGITALPDITPPRHKGLRHLCRLLRTSVAATVATAPIVAATFHQLPLLGWLMSAIYIPITAVAIPAILLCIAFPLPCMASAIDALLGLQLWLMEHTGCAIQGLHPSWCTVGAAYSVMVLLACRRYFMMWLAAATLVLSITADHIM